MSDQILSVLVILLIVWMVLMAFGLYNRYVKHMCLCDLFYRNDKKGTCHRCGLLKK